MYHHHDLENEIQNPLASASRFLKARTKGNLEVKPVTVTNLSTFHPFNHSTNYPSRLTPNLSRKCAFTLAEVLITLGIIGVVAALTMPLLIRKYNEMVTINQLKKVYAEFSQAIKLSEINNGELSTWEWGIYNQTPAFMNKYILPYFKDTRSCSVRQGTKCLFPCDYGWKKMNGDCANQGGYYFYLLNGYPTAVVTAATACTSSTNVECSDKLRYVDIIVDVNGTKGQSIMGKDVFLFTLFNYKYDSKFAAGNGEHYGLKLGGTCSHHGCYTKTINALLNGTCKSTDNSIHSGKECGLVLEKNGWKVPKGYPIKF